ncbi:DUF4374 domain-containing protein [Sphingobacterium sp. lm-10]|uniref:DUF4374 domain-containing protein n=1 Tax=Sphingobacterium sp. lm-10 TaxID=2944904 RepID=UPI0020204444|nr:DUF4374 domain-containing protein [Sphingobacterium sp. lm-10]MCL7987611.1 DUF4374 domain-containing protein [Sphingobacterium sp. lm-10]
MNTTKVSQFIQSSVCLAVALGLASCSKDNNNLNTVPLDGNVYTLGLGVTTPEGTTNYVTYTNDLMNGTISLLKNGSLQDGYRDYANIGNYFQAVGGLGLTDVNTYYVQANAFQVKTGLNLSARPVDTMDPDGKGTTMIAVTLPAKPTEGTEMSFATVDVASNMITSTKKVTVNNTKFPIENEWMLHTGLAISGNQAFQTILPFDSEGWNTRKTDKTYVAVYSYPEFVLQNVITDERTGPAGAFGTRSGIFATESGDVYTISHSGYGYNQRSKAPAVLKIASGTATFDTNYLFETMKVDNGGRIVHAIYIGNNKLFATVSTGEQAAQWDDKNLKFAIVDLKAQTITAVAGSPTFSGNGGRSFAAFHRNGKAYAAATVNEVLNVYEIDLTRATARKGAQVDASFVGGLGQIQ